MCSYHCDLFGVFAGIYEFSLVRALLGSSLQPPLASNLLLASARSLYGFDIIIFRCDCCFSFWRCIHFMCLEKAVPHGQNHFCTSKLHCGSFRRRDSQIMLSNSFSDIPHLQTCWLTITSTVIFPGMSGLFLFVLHLTTTAGLPHRAYYYQNYFYSPTRIYAASACSRHGACAYINNVFCIYKVDAGYFSRGAPFNCGVCLGY